MNSAVACPLCGAASIPLLYGLPTREAEEAARRGEVAFGGCTVDPIDPSPDRLCTGAEAHRWREGAR